jgi:undecaprenyl-diphosphatase
MVAAGLVVFTVCAVIVANGRVGPTERAVFHAVNGLPGWLYQPMLYAQYLGVLAMPLVVAAGALLWRRWRLAAALVLVVPCKLGLEQVAKLLVQRQLSFTSGHAIITFAIAGLLVLVLPRRWGVLAIALAVCNAVARVYLGAHNPLDVVGGAAIGLIIAAVLDMILDVARVHGRGRTRQNAPARENASPEAGPPEAGTAGQGP